MNVFFRKSLLLAVAFSLISVSAATPRLTRANSPSKEREGATREYIAGRILLKFKDGAGPTAYIEDVAGKLAGARNKKAEVLSDEPDNSLYSIELGGGISVEDAIKLAASDPRIEYAEPDYIYRAAETIPNDPLFDALWGMRNLGFLNGSPFGVAGSDIDAARAWDITTGSEDIVVAVIDTGADLTHFDLAPNAWRNPGEIPGNGTDDDSNGYVDDVSGWNFITDSNRFYDDGIIDEHGTHVAGIIGAAGNNAIGVTGVAWRVRIMSLKFLGERGGSSSDAVKAINYVIDQKRRGVNVKAINASWSGTGNSLSLRKAIEKAAREGILFVCSAGNESENNDLFPSYPANWSRELSAVLSVAALTRFDNIAYFSNYGHTAVSVGAPGYNILSTLPGGAYGGADGTSQSAPHVTGIAVLLSASDSSLTPEQIKRRIVSTAEPVLGLASSTVSAGRASAYNALINRIPPKGPPDIKMIGNDKKKLIIDGLGFVDGSSIVEVSFQPLAGVKHIYDPAYKIANGSLTRITVKMSKAQMANAFPLSQTITVSVFNPATGERSPGFQYTRHK